MDLQIQTNDDPQFVETVSHIISGLVNDSFPNEIFVIKIGNWFDHKWLKFSGKRGITLLAMIQVASGEGSPVALHAASASSSISRSTRLIV